MTATEKRAEAVRLMKSRAGMNTYTQGDRRVYFFGYPNNDGGKGYSDCSSSVRACIKRATGIDIGYNTDAQMRNRGKGVIVETAKSGQLVPTEKLLKPGDAIYYKGNDAHTLNVGHVEMYTGGGTLYGHGSGVGPKKHGLAAYSKARTGSRSYLMAIRWILDGDDTPAPERHLGDRDRLENGDIGQDVAELQAALIALGYDCGKYGIDGEFGADTLSAVSAFQLDHGLTGTGRCGPQTIAKILALTGDTDKPDDTYPAPPELPKAGSVIVTGGTVNLRTGPGKQYSAACVVKQGDLLEAVEPQGWLPVLVNGAVRWISPKMAEKVVK